MSDEDSPMRKVTAVAVQRLFLDGYMPRKNIANEERTKAMVPASRVILAGTEGVPRMSMIPKTVRFKAASIPGKQALTMGFISLSSDSEDIVSEWTTYVYTALDALCLKDSF